jgi:DNA polymerase-3 subunit alpha
MNKRVAESLVLAGAFDELDSFHRGQYFDIDMAGRTNLEETDPIWAKLPGE